MKQLSILIILIALSGIPVQASELTWLTDFSKAQVQAKAEHKPILLLFIGRNDSDWCPPCRKMKKALADSDEFAAYAKNNLVLVLVGCDDANEDHPDELNPVSYALVKKFLNGSDIPRVVLLNESNAVFYTSQAGYKEGDGVDGLLSEIKTHVNSDRIHPAEAVLPSIEQLIREEKRIPQLEDQLRHGVENGDMTMVKEALESGIDPDKVEKDGQTMLQIAAARGHLDIIKLLLDRGTENNIQDALQTACAHGQIDAVHLLLEHGAIADLVDSSGQSALHYLAYSESSNNVSIAKWLLLQKDMKVNARDSEGRTPLLICTGHDRQLAQFLIKNGADINIPDSKSTTPLLKALINRDFDWVNFLLQNGADPSVQLLEGNALALGESVDIGSQPLHIAAYFKQINTVKLLLEKGADVNAKNDAGKTPIQMTDDPGIKELLRKAGAKE